MANELNNLTNPENLFQNTDEKEELLEQLIANEENYIANILLKCLKFCPSSFGEIYEVYISSLILTVFFNRQATIESWGNKMGKSWN